MNHRRTEICFNKAHQTYDSHNHVQRYVNEILINLLLKVENKFPITIDLGCGTGAATKILAKKIIYHHFYAIDVAELLLAHAEKKLKTLDIKTHLSSFDHILFTNEYFHLAFANMSLQWSVDIENTIQYIHSRLANNGMLAFSIPLTNTFHELKNHFSINSFHTFDFIKKLLLKYNFSIMHAESHEKIESFDSTLDALKSIKQVGANATSKPSCSFLRGRSSLPKVTSLTYHLGYFIARKEGNSSS